MSLYTFQACQTVKIFDTRSLFEGKKTIKTAKFQSDDDNTKVFQLSLGFAIPFKEGHFRALLTSQEGALVEQWTMVLFSSDLKEVKRVVLEDAAIGPDQISGWRNNYYDFPIPQDYTGIEKSIEGWNLLLSCTVVYEVVITDDPLLSCDYKDLFYSMEDADVTFSVQGKIIQAHKLILKTRSTYFKNLFNSNMKESLTSSILINECDPEIFEAVLYFLYTDMCPSRMKDIRLKLLPIADRYMITKLRKMCIDSLMSSIEESNLQEILTWAHRLDIFILKRKCFCFLQNNNAIHLWNAWPNDLCKEVVLEYLEFLGEKTCTTKV